MTTEPAATRGDVARIGVVVPAKDEAELIGVCLAALNEAARMVEVPVAVCVVADACTDGTADLVTRITGAASLELRLATVDDGSVGAARRAGMAELITVLGVEGTWLATTDADSVVPSDWLCRQLLHAAGGAGMVAGTIEVRDWSDRQPGLRSIAQIAYRRPGRHHVHGANLSFWAADYQRVGGFAPVDSDEDVGLVGAFVDLGIAVGWADDIAVRTSSRRLARAPSGFAGYLDDLEELGPVPVVSSA